MQGEQDSPSFGHIEFKLSVLAKPGEPNTYVQTFEGTIFASDPDDWEPEAGIIKAYVVEYEQALMNGQSLFEAMDCESSSTLECFDALFEVHRGELRRKISDSMICFRSELPNLMLLEAIELKPEFRGLGIGREAVRTVIGSLGSSCKLIACKPFPLQYEGFKSEEWQSRRELPGFERERLTAWKKVRRFWFNLGFLRVPRTEYYVWSEPFIEPDEY